MFKSSDGITIPVETVIAFAKKKLGQKAFKNFHLYQPHYGVNSAVTRRWTSAYHGIPANSDVKAAFVPIQSNGIFLHADFAQNEYKVFAALAGEEAIVQAFREGKDIHRFIASKTFKKPESEINSAERNVAKRLSFGLLYGKSVAAIADDYFNGDVEYAQNLFDMFYAMFPNIKVYMEKQKQMLFEFGYVTTVFGDPIHIQYDASKQSQVNEAIRFAVNYPTQSSASSVAALVGYKFGDYAKNHGMDVSIPGFIHDCLEGSFGRSDVIEVFDQLPKFAEDWTYNTFKLPMSIDIEIGVRGGPSLVEFKRLKDRKVFVEDGVMSAKFEGRESEFNKLVDRLREEYVVDLEDVETEPVIGKWSDLYMRVASGYHMHLGVPVPHSSGKIHISKKIA